MSNGDKEDRTLRDLFCGQWPEAKKMSKEDLIEEVKMWRVVASWLTDDVKYYLGHIGEMVRVVRRDYHGFVGDFLVPRFTLKDVEIGVKEKVFDQNEGDYFWESKIVSLPLSSVIDIEFIAERYQVDKLDEETVSDMKFE